MPTWAPSPGWPPPAESRLGALWPAQGTQPRRGRTPPAVQDQEASVAQALGRSLFWAMIASRASLPCPTPLPRICCALHLVVALCCCQNAGRLCGRRTAPGSPGCYTGLVRVGWRAGSCAASSAPARTSCKQCKGPNRGVRLQLSGGNTRAQVAGRPLATHRFTRALSSSLSCGFLLEKGHIAAVPQYGC